MVDVTGKSKGKSEGKSECKSKGKSKCKPMKPAALALFQNDCWRKVAIALIDLGSEGTGCCVSFNFGVSECQTAGSVSPARGLGSSGWTRTTTRLFKSISIQTTSPITIVIRNGWTFQ
jgi:hypothetical protein